MAYLGFRVWSLEDIYFLFRVKGLGIMVRV